MRFALAAAALLLAAAAPAAAPARFIAPGAELEVSLDSGLPLSWRVCRPDCRTPRVQRELLGPAAVLLRWDGDAALAGRLATAGYRAERHGDELRLRSLQPVAGRIREHRYRWDPATGSVALALDLPRGAGLSLRAEPGFAPEPLPGFGSIYSRVRAIVVDENGQQWLDEWLQASPSAAPGDGDWLGLRQRFWAVLLQSSRATTVTLEQAQANMPVLRLRFPEQEPQQLRLAAGPVERAWLRSVDPVLGGLLYAALWNWLRGLCILMAGLLGLLVALTGSPGGAIMLLSLCVKLLMSPLTRIADRWQAEVQRIQARLEPELAAIRRQFRGEEAHERVLAVYRQQGVSPWYTLKSAAGFLIQIPVFIAAFDTLGESFLLHQAGFLWIDDLAKPDRLAPLPLALPFFGA
ncbi:MAG: hypothetical protein D6727_01505, partial [Gammaproteobacteria bacterium]